MKVYLLLALCLLSSISIAQTTQSAEVKPYQGRPTLFVNGKPQTPAFYALTHAYGGRWSWEEVAARNLNNFCQIGFRLYQVDLWLEDSWFQHSDTLDLRKARRQVRGVLDQCPEAGVVIRIHVNAPFWWNKANPAECTQYADAPVDTTLKAGPPYHNEEHDIHAALRASLASTKWKSEAGQKLVEFCQRLSKTPEGNAILGMHVAGGIYGEWHYWGFIEHDPDTGPAMTAYFRNWLKAKYKTSQALQKAWQSSASTFENATVPNVADRLKTHDGFFKDPVQDQRTIDYFTAQQQVVADDAIYFCRLVKENWPRPLITGIFYGYLHMTFNRQTVGGHLFIRQVLDSPYVDYLSAPQTYWPDSRKAGGSGNSRGLIESTLLHGKLWFDEIDNGYLYKNDFENIRYVSRYDSTYANIMKRCALLPLMRGIGFWFYDFGVQKSFGWWDDPGYLASMKAEKELFDKRLTVPYHSEADVLYVWSQDVFYYLKSAPLPITVNVLDHSIEQAMRSGTVGDHVYDFDLERVNLSQYKAIVFMNVYKLTDDQRKYIREKVARQERTIIWNYLTGYTNGQRLDLAFVKSLTGMSLERIDGSQKPTVSFLKPVYTYNFSGPVDPLVVVTDKTAEPLAELQGGKQTIIARKKESGFTSVFCGLPLNGTGGFREIFRQAGCHIYNERDDFTYANSGLLLLHTKDGGTRTLRLKNGKFVTVPLTQGSTLLLDAQTGETILK
ncbi:hypothetical protein [Spirosoma gilvum]